MTTIEISIQYQNLIDKILFLYAGELFKDEVKKAKSEFFDNAGILEENSPQFELRMSQFFDWYFFSRELSGYNKSPLSIAHQSRELRLTPEEEVRLEKLRTHRHGLFEFIKIKDSNIYLKDLFKNEKLVVKESPWTFGFSSDEIFEARLIPFEDSYVFTKGFCFHPEDAKKFILSEVKRHRKDPDLDQELMMLRLIKMRYKFERYRHVDIKMIYSNEGKLGL